MTSENEHPAAKEQPYPIDEPTASRRIAEAAVADTVTGAMADPIELTITPAEPRAAIAQEQYLALLQEYARRVSQAGLEFVERVLGAWRGDRMLVWTVVDEADHELRRTVYRVQEAFWDAHPDVFFDFRVIRRRGIPLEDLYGPLSEYTIIDLRRPDVEPRDASSKGGA